MTTQIALPEQGIEPGEDVMARARARPWLLAWLAFVPVAVLRAGTLAEGDTFWEIRGGLLTLSHQAIPRVDSFTWTVHGKPWTLNSWGFDVVLAVAYRIGGLPAVAWASAALAMMVAGMVLLLARCLGASPQVAGWLLLLGSPLLIEWLSARPQLADYIAVPVLVMLLRRITDGRDRVRSIMAVGILSVGWVNLHAASLLGVVIAGACAVLLLARRASRGNGWWCVAAGAAALAGSLLNPYGLGVLAQAGQVQSAASGLIVEWRAFDPASPMQLSMFITGLTALVLAARRGDAVLTGALGVPAAGSVVVIRFLPFLVLLGLPIIAGALSRTSHPAVLRYARSRRVMFRRCGSAGMAAFAALAALSLTHIGRPDPAIYPVPIVKDIPPRCKVFTSDLLGGFVILQRPDAPVSLDSRFDLYGRQRVLADVRALQGRGNPVSELTGAGCVLVPPTSGLASQLHRDPAWQVRASGAAAILFVRR